MKARAPRVLVAALLLSALAFPMTMPVATALHIPGHDLVWVRDYTFAPYLANSPYGKLNILVTILKLLHDTTSSYDWYFYEFQVQSVPGKVAYSSNW